MSKAKKVKKDKRAMIKFDVKTNHKITDMLRQNSANLKPKNIYRCSNLNSVHTSLVTQQNSRNFEPNVNLSPTKFISTGNTKFDGPIRTEAIKSLSLFTCNELAQTSESET